MLTTQMKMQLKQCESSYMLGMLATGEAKFPTTGIEQHYISKSRHGSSIIFYVKPLSYEQEPIKNILDPYHPDSKLYMGLDEEQSEVILPISYKFCKDIHEKKRIIEDMFLDRLLLFKPIISFESTEKGDIPYKKVDVITIETDIRVTGKETYVPIPIINARNSSFERKLIENSGIIMKDYGHSMVDPAYIICGGYIYWNLDSWTKDENNDKTWTFTGQSNKVRKIRFDMEGVLAEKKLVKGTNNILFIDRDYLYENINSIDNIDHYNEKISALLQETNSQVAATSTKSYFFGLVESIIDENFGSEYEFLSNLKEYTVSEGLCYDMRDLVNLHICAKTNPLTIISGMSGTGKTQLARAYGKMLNSSEQDGTLLFLPINPSYTEPGDLLGYLNNTNGLFIPSETRLTEFLIAAEEDSGRMYVVIFDEMNLSQVEHWFAPFISLLELKPEERKLSLYSHDANCFNSSTYPSTISIGDNIIFLGTVNMDETTKDFSDRLLDRANVINLGKTNFAQFKEEQNSHKYRCQKGDRVLCPNASTYSYWIVSDDSLSAYNSKELQFFDDLHELIQSYDAQKGVSFRIIDRIGRYLLNIPYGHEDTPLLTRGESIDLQIKQRLLTKLKGMEGQYGKLIGTMANGDLKPQNSALYDFFNGDAAKKISDFTLTKAEICRKAKELTIYGYTY